MNVYAHRDYRKLIKLRIRELNRADKNFTLKRVAEKIRLQYPYLCRLLGPTKYHLSEDHLYELSQLLQLTPDEQRYLSLLRDCEAAASSKRKQEIQKEIQAHRDFHLLKAEKLPAQTHEADAERDYLLDPLAVVVHLAFHIDEYRKEPSRISARLGLNPTKLQSIIRTLISMNFVEKNRRGEFQLCQRQSHRHYPSGHPFTRTHQSLLRTLSSGQILRLSESEKDNWNVSFTCDPASLEKIKAELTNTLKKLEEIVVPAPSQQVYQISLDLFKWV